MSTATPAVLPPDQQHGNMLKNALQFSKWPDQGVAPGITVKQVGKCLAAIAQGTPVSPPALAIFVMQEGWYHHEAIRDLFKAYVDAGYISLRARNDRSSHPLEAAISRPNVDLLRVLLDCGADEREVPSPACRLHMEVGDGSEPDDTEATEVRDAFHFVELINGDTPTAQAMTVLLRAHSMRRVISSGQDTAAEARGPDASSGIRRPRRAPV